MDIDIERLKADREYWDEVAPDFCNWACVRGGRLRGWLEYELGDEDGDLIPRPTKAPPAEWDGDGEPPIGCEIKVWFNSAGAGCWERGEVIAQDGNMTVVKVNGAYYGRNTGGDLMAPIRTKQERQRDELANSVEAGMRKCGFVPSPTDCKIVAVELLSRYNLEPKP